MHQFLLSFGRNGHDRSHYADTIGAACRQALADLGLASGRGAFDDLRFGHLLAMDSVTITDGYDPMMYARCVKTPAEIELLRRAARLNEQAICTTIGQLQRGMTWREFNHAYHKTVIDLGGFVRGPGDEHHRIWLEEVIRVTSDGGEALFDWGLDPLIAT